MVMRLLVVTSAGLVSRAEVAVVFKRRRLSHLGFYLVDFLFDKLPVFVASGLELHKDLLLVLRFLFRELKS